MNNKLSVIFLSIFLQLSVYAQSDRVNKYAVTWDNPSGNSSGAMPIGNGEVGANVWVEDNGDILFYLSRTDAWAENSSLYKLGRIRVSISPNPLKEDTRFSQSLDLENGAIEIQFTNGKERIDLSFIVDSELPVVFLQGKSTQPLQATVSSEIWRTTTRVMPNAERHFALEKCPHDSLATEYPDVVVNRNKNLIVYHRNEHSIYPFTLIHQGLSTGSFENDPFINRTMGYNVYGDLFVKKSATSLSTEAPTKDFELKIVAHTDQTKTADAWISQTEQLMKETPSFEKVRKRTSSWWNKHWDKSYIEVKTPDDSTGYQITQSYVLQSWMTACAGRGNYPIKFNGSIFTVDPCHTDAERSYSPDYRLWGPDYWWQNTRLIYHSMLKTGDYEMMKVLFKHYYSNLPMMKRIGKAFYGVEGAVSPETATIFGTFVNHDYGWDRSGMKQGEIENEYVRYYWSSALEIVGLMLDYHQYTLDQEFAKKVLIPTAFQFLSFYNTYFPKGTDGKIRITPAHSLETYWGNVVNDLPNVAGLHYVVKGLQQLPSELSTDADKKLWDELFCALPKIPVIQKEGQSIFSPAQTYSEKRTNVENPELYSIFPFSLCNMATADKQTGINSYKQRIIKESLGWSQDGQQAARLGLTDEVKKDLLAKIRNKNPNHRFPAIWGPNYDWTPDQDLGSNLLVTLQDMVMQSYGSSVYLLPAFPKEWDVSFKLYTPGDNRIEGCYENGAWKVVPVFLKKTNLSIIK